MKYFTEDEMRCKCGCGVSEMHPDFMGALNELREYCDFPFPVTSGYRCPDHNEAVSGTGRNGPHTTGRAVDIAISGERAYRLIEAATRHGFMGIGVKQHGAHKNRFIHLDDLASGTRPWVWSYQ